MAYSMKLAVDITPTVEEKREADEAIAGGAEKIDREGNIIAPETLQKRFLESNPQYKELVESGQVDIIYDPLTQQVLIGHGAK